VTPDKIARVAGQIVKLIEGAAAATVNAVLIYAVPILLMSGDEPRKDGTDKATPARPKSKVERAADTRTKIETAQEAQEQLEDLEFKQQTQRKWERLREEDSDEGTPEGIRDTTKSQRRFKNYVRKVGPDDYE
jgi:D-aminopeptidase